MENPKHTIKNNNDGRFTLAMDGALPKVHTFIPSPTPSISVSVTPSTTPPLPSVTPTLSLTPSPSYQNNNTYAIYGITNDGTGLTGTGDTAGFDGGGYTYSWQNLFANATTFYDAGTYWINDNSPGGSNEFFPIGSAAAQLGTIFTQPRFFKPWINGQPNLQISSPYRNKRSVWLLAAGIEGGGSVNAFYNYRNKDYSQYYSQGYFNTIYMDDWCAGSTSQSVAVSMNRRNDAGGGGQSLTARIYRYHLPQVASNEEIMSVGFYNSGSNSDKTRIVSVAFADA